MAVETKLVTFDEYEAFAMLPENANTYFELINGEIVQKVPTKQHGLIAGRFIGEIYIYLQEHPGEVAPEVLHRLPEDTFNGRMPDVAVYADPTKPEIKRGAVPEMPDLAIEIQSPNNTYKARREKAAYYLANGSRIVWLAYSEKRIIEVQTKNDVKLLGEDDTLDGGDVLPGFSLPIGKIFSGRD